MEDYFHKSLPQLRFSVLLALILNFCFSKPTLEIGSDFYRYHLSNDGRFILAVGDVSGHGIPAALLMAATLTLFDASLSQNLRPSERLIQLDRELVAYTEPRHQNCAFCYLELAQGVLHVTNAGGIPPFIRKSGGDVERVSVNGFPLGHGLGAECGYMDLEIRLSDGDTVILLSDGAVEAKDGNNTMYGFSRLQQTIASSPNGTAQALLDYLVGEVTGFIDKSQPQDDFTIVVMQVHTS